MRRFAILALGSLALLCAACGSSGPSPPEPTSAPTFAVAGPDPTRGMLEPRADGDVVVAAKRGFFRVFTAPSSLAKVRLYRPVNDWGQPLWLPAIGNRDVTGQFWFQVLLPDRPNGSTGWLRARDVDTSTVQDRIVVLLHSLHQALEDSLVVDARMLLLFCFAVGALLAAGWDRPQDAATLLGAHDRLREELGTTLEDYERTLLDGVEGNTRPLLGDEGFARAFEHGRSLLIEDAASLARALTTDA